MLRRGGEIILANHLGAEEGLASRDRRKMRRHRQAHRMVDRIQAVAHRELGAGERHDRARLRQGCLSGRLLQGGALAQARRQRARGLACEIPLAPELDEGNPLRPEIGREASRSSCIRSDRARVAIDDRKDVARAETSSWRSHGDRAIRLRALPARAGGSNARPPSRAARSTYGEAELRRLHDRSCPLRIADVLARHRRQAIRQLLAPHPVRPKAISSPSP